MQGICVHHANHLHPLNKGRILHTISFCTKFVWRAPYYGGVLLQISYYPPLFLLYYNALICLHLSWKPRFLKKASFEKTILISFCYSPSWKVDTKMLAFTCVRGVGLCVRPLSTHACDNAKAVVFELLAGRDDPGRSKIKSTYGGCWTPMGYLSIAHSVASPRGYYFFWSQCCPTLVESVS